MATVIETVEKDGQAVHVYDNGMERNADNGRMVRPPTAALIKTTERANELQRRRQELKYERARQGANAALLGLRKKNHETGQSEPVWENPQDLDFVEAIVEAQAAQALMAGDPSSTKAAEFVMNHTGLAESKVPDGQPGSDAHALIGAAVVEYVRRLHEGMVRTDIPISPESADSRVIDGEESGSPADPETGQ